MVKKTRIRKTREKKSTLQRQKQTQDVKQAVRVVVNLQDKRARRRPARKPPNAAPFRGEPLSPSFARVSSDKPVIMSSNITDDQRKAIMAEGAKQLQLEMRQQQLLLDRETAIENTRDFPALKYGGARSESNFSTTGSSTASLASSLAKVKDMRSSLDRMTGSSGIPSIAPSLMTATQTPSAEQDLSGFGGRGKDANQKIADELRKLTSGSPEKMRSAANLRSGGWTTDMITELDNQAKAYLSRNPTTSLNKTVQKRIRDLATGAVVLGQVEEVLPEDEDGDFV